MYDSNVGSGADAYAPAATGGFAGWWANFDADKTFAYTTFRKVKLQDRTLGFVDIILKVAIAIYIVMFVMFYNGGYLKISPPSGTTRLSFLEKNYTTELAAGRLDYLKSVCTTPPFNAAPVSHVTGPCSFIPASMFVQPPAVGPFALVATRVTRNEFNTNGCNVSEPTCEYKRVPNTYNTVYPAGVELSTLFIDHNIRSSHGFVIKDLGEMSGTLLDCNERLMKTFSPKASYENTSEYISKRAFSVRTLFEAASGGVCGSVDLDSPSRVSIDPADRDNTIRYDGAVFIVSITYDNTHYFKVNEVKFKIRVRRLPGTEYKFLNVDPDALVSSFPNKYTLINTHGLMIVVVQTGRVGDFDGTTLLIQLTASLTLLAVSAKLTDMLAYWVLPHKMEYRKYMMKVSSDFSEVRDAKMKKEGLLDNEVQMADI